MKALALAWQEDHNIVTFSFCPPPQLTDGVLSSTCLECLLSGRLLNTHMKNPEPHLPLNFGIHWLGVLLEDPRALGKSWMGKAQESGDLKEVSVQVDNAGLADSIFSRGQSLEFWKHCTKTWIDASGF